MYECNGIICLKTFSDVFNLTRRRSMHLIDLYIHSDFAMTCSLSIRQSHENVSCGIGIGK